VLRVLVGKPEEKSSLQDLIVDRDKIKMDLKRISVKWHGFIWLTVCTYVGECKQE
jgi:hypothetical protein